MHSIPPHSVHPLSRPADWLPSPLPANHPLQRWLSDPASLTARLKARSRNLFVEVLFQGRGRPHHDEALLLGLRQGEEACVREVLLVADGTPVVYARSLLRRDSLRGPWRVFSGMGARPLGAALFADPLIRRGPLGARRLDARDARYKRINRVVELRSGQALWARRSCFTRDARPLIVCEVFLPAILNLPR